MEPLAGRLLIANAGLYDPNFRRSIVLVGHHDDEDGAVGVILNRPLEIGVAEAVPALAPLVPDGDPVFRGGPVQPSAAVVVADFTEPERAGVIAFDSIGFLPEHGDDDISGAIRRARVFAGYAGWGPGQLEDELADGSWLELPASAEDVFHQAPDRLWAEVVARLGGNAALLRTLPEDPTLN
jgi:putative transcriptional regulator